MRIVPVLAGLFVAGVLPAFGTEHEECKAKIQRLQERLDLLEAKIAVILASEPAQLKSQAPVLTMDLPPRRTTFDAGLPPELLPEIGKIGAQVGLVLSGSTSPFHLRSGREAAGFIDLPLFEPKRLHGKISYEIRVGLSEAKASFRTTSNVAQVANLAALTALNPGNGTQNLIDSVTGTGLAPFPVVAVTETRAKLLQVVPFSLKYTSTVLERYRLRPYAIAGFGTYVTIHKEVQSNPGFRPDAGLSQDQLAVVRQVFGGMAPFGSALVAGQIAQSSELTARGFPSGSGNIDFGLVTGGGLEYRLTRGLSLGFDGRFNRISGGQNMATFGTRIGLHF